MKICKLLPHTADTRLYVEADTLPELFEAAVEGMGNIVKSAKCKVQSLDVIKEIKVESQDITSLLIDFLSEALTLSQEEKAVFRKADIKKLTGNSIESKVYGEKTDEFDEDIKAVTYHEAEVKKNSKGNWEVVIVFDI